MVLQLWVTALCTFHGDWEPLSNRVSAKLMDNLQRWRMEMLDVFKTLLVKRKINPEDVEQLRASPPRPSIIIESVQEMPMELVLTRDEMSTFDISRVSARIPTGLTPYWLARPVIVTLHVRFHIEQGLENQQKRMAMAAAEAAAAAAGGGGDYKKHQSPTPLTPTQGQAGKRKKKKKGKLGAAGLVGSTTNTTQAARGGAGAGAQAAEIGLNAGPTDSGGSTRPPYKFNRRDMGASFPLKLWFARGPLPRQQVKDLQGSCGPLFSAAHKCLWLWS